MTTKRSPAGGPSRHAPRPRSGPRPAGLALLGLALLGLAQAGCKSDGCSTCGFGNSLSNGLKSVGDSVKGVFHHKKACGGGSDCGCGGAVGGIEEGVVVDQGIPVVPGGMVVPPSGGVLPPPAIDSEPTQLQAIPNPAPAPTSGTSTNSKTTTSRSTPAGTSRPGYTTSLPRGGTLARRGSDADPAAYSASKGTARSTDPLVTLDPLENIPPVDLPSEVTRKAVVAPNSTPTPTAATPAPAEKVSAAEGAMPSLPPIGAASPYQAPGIARYSSIAPSIAGGSAPSPEGLAWLKEKGCKTLIDLRRGVEIDPNFVDAVNDRGMVYISLPLLANRLDPSRLARFDDLISRAENRPLFFCDSDGSRAALAWYIHERVVGREDAQAASSKAEELGLGPAEIKLAEEYLANQKPKAKAAMARVALADPSPTTPAPAPASAAEEPPLALPETPSPPIAPSAAPASPARLDEASPDMLPGEPRPQASKASSPDYRDPLAWRPVAALVLTSIGVPLAFWSRTIFTEYRHDRRRALASLPGRARRSLDAPVGSDA